MGSWRLWRRTGGGSSRTSSRFSLWTGSTALGLQFFSVVQKTIVIPQVLFLGKVLDVPVIVQRQVLGETVLKTVVFRSCSSSSSWWSSSWTSNFLWIPMPRWARSETSSYLYGACKQVSEFLKLPDSVLHLGFWNISCGFILYHTEGFQLFRCLQSSGACQAKIPRGYWWHAVRACSPMGGSAFGCAQDERQKVAAVLQWQEDPPGHALRGVQGMGCRQVCRCAAAAHLAGRAGGSGVCRYGSRRKISILSWVMVVSNENSTKDP